MPFVERAGRGAIQNFVSALRRGNFYFCNPSSIEMGFPFELLPAVECVARRNLLRLTFRTKTVPSQSPIALRQSYHSLDTMIELKHTVFERKRRLIANG